MSDHASHGSGHISPISLYITIFLALMVGTALTVGAAFVDLGMLNFPVAMLIAVVKASLVVWYFMHVKWQSHLTKLTLATGLFFLAILLGMMLIDYTSKDFTPMLRPTDAAGQMAAPETH
ncbi:MAG: cytochrome C oxidase subunit IV family protein [Acidimicrobiia bacterium]